jgi:hypothetical protein
MPRSDRQPAIAAGFWFGNSDHSNPRLVPPIFSMDNAGEAWHGFMQEYLKGKPTASFRRPPGVVTATIDRFTGGQPGPWTQGTVRELFIEGTEPGARRAIDPPGLLYCGSVVMPLNAESPDAPDSWVSAVDSWAARPIGSRGRGGAVKSTFSLAGIDSFGGPTAPGRCNGGPVRVAADGRPSSSDPADDDDEGPADADAVERPDADRDRDGGRLDGPHRGGGGGGGGDPDRVGREDRPDRGGPGPTPTCRPGSLTSPPGCVVPAPG